LTSQPFMYAARCTQQQYQLPYLIAPTGWSKRAGLWRGKPIYSLSYTILDEIYCLFYTWDSDWMRLERLQRTAIEQEARIRGPLGRPGAWQAQREPIGCENVSIHNLYVHCNWIYIMYKVFIMNVHFNSFHLLCSWIFMRQKIFLPYAIVRFLPGLDYYD